MHEGRDARMTPSPANRRSFYAYLMRKKLGFRFFQTSVNVFF